MDPWNQPAPFKRYPSASLSPLPTDLPFHGPAAIEVLAGQTTPEPAAVDSELLARLLFFSGGVTRVLGRGRHRLYFRTAASAGNLHPLETYALSSDLPGLNAGVYHFAPDAFALECLRNGDYQASLADAAVEPALAATQTGLVVTGIPWRTAWKYGERGWRHLYWDLGTMLANLMGVAEAHGVKAQVLFGFRDAVLSRLLGIDGTTEFPLVVLSFSSNERPATRARDVELLHQQPAQLSRTPIEFPLITAAQHAGALDSSDQVQAWRAAATRSEVFGAASTFAAPVARTAKRSEPMEAVILRRGSTRAMRHAVVPADVLARGMAYATRPLSADALPTGRTLLRHLISVHAVDGIPAGQYDFHRGELKLQRRLSPEQARVMAAHLCLAQELGGDSAYTLFICTNLDEVFDTLGDRGYRVVQTEAGIVAGRLQLAAFAMGYGATALTFYDDAVARSFEMRTDCMMACAVGVPAYRSRPGGLPLHPTELG